MTQKISLTATFLFLNFFQSICWSQEKNTQPNIIVILADDIGYGDLSAYQRLNGGTVKVETPQLDQLMKEGISFTDGHSPTALCAPSRYSVMTGQNTYHNYSPWGVWGSYQKTAIKKDDLTLGKVMKNAGYETAFLGKWHLASDYYRKDSKEIYRRKQWKPMELEVDVSQIVGNGPKQQGFNYSFMYPAGIQDVPYVVYENEKWYPLDKKSEIGVITKKKMKKKKVTLDKDEGLGDTKWNPFEMGILLANKGVEYIQKVPNDKPFFMYYCTQAVHKPHTPAKELNGKKIKGTSEVYHLDLIKELDTQIEMMVSALKKKGVYENTVIVFTSDNGGLMFGSTLRTGHKPCGVLKGGKNNIFEGGHRVPFIFTWPGKIKPNTISNALISGTDILATIAAMANQKVPEGKALDSKNLLPTLLGEKKITNRKMMLQGGTSNEVAFRDGDWKLIMDYDKYDETFIASKLFNLKDSIREYDDLIDLPENQVRVKEMLKEYINIRTNKIATKQL